MTYKPLLLDADMQALIAAPPLGRGGARIAHPVTGDPNVVIKEVHLEFPGANFLEWNVWNAVKETALKDTFGECFSISMTGRYMIMERLDDLVPADYPNSPTAPSWVDDIMPKNFGKNQAGVIKLRDYAMLCLEKVLNTPGGPSDRAAWQLQTIQQILGRTS